MARILGKGSWSSTPSRIASAVAAVRGAPGAGSGELSPLRMTLGPRPLVVGGEIASIAAVPDTAVVLATRGRVPRRDVVRLRPEYPGEERASANGQERAQSRTSEPRIKMSGINVLARDAAKGM
jgi:hypothetical protein